MLLPLLDLRASNLDFRGDLALWMEGQKVLVDVQFAHLLGKFSEIDGLTSEGENIRIENVPGFAKVARRESQCGDEWIENDVAKQEGVTLNRTGSSRDERGVLMKRCISCHRIEIIIMIQMPIEIALCQFLYDFISINAPHSAPPIAQDSRLVCSELNLLFRSAF